MATSSTLGANTFKNIFKVLYNLPSTITYLTSLSETTLCGSNSISQPSRIETPRALEDLVTVSLCIQNAINKMQLSLLSITYSCPYQNLTATMGHSIHNIDISKPLTHMTLHTLSAICPKTFAYSGQLNDDLQSGRAPDEDDKHADKQGRSHHFRSKGGKNCSEAY